VSSSEKAEEENAPDQYILTIGCPRGGLKSGVIGNNTEESTDRHIDNGTKD
jgi:hypothetical protein